MICVVAYGKIIPKEILEIPKFGCINVHGSLLPKYRGAAPIQWAVINGDKETGVTTMFMDEGMDTGDMILKEVVQIGENETTGELWDRLSVIGGNLLVKTLEVIEDGSVQREKQGEEFTMAPMLNKDIAIIDWKNKTAKEIKDLVRGLNPFMASQNYSSRLLARLFINNLHFPKLYFFIQQPGSLKKFLLRLLCHYFIFTKYFLQQCQHFFYIPCTLAFSCSFLQP